MKFTEAQLEKAIIDLLGTEGYRHVHGGDIQRSKSEVLFKDDLKEFLLRRYEDVRITESEVDAIIRQLEMMSSADLYESNKAVMKMVCDGMYLKREDRSQKDLYVQLIDFSDLAEHVVPAEGEVPTVGVLKDRALEWGKHTNICKVVNQLREQRARTQNGKVTMRDSHALVPSFVVRGRFTVVHFM